jgi:DNA-binding HxlR family transcriptional regulator
VTLDERLERMLPPELIERRPAPRRVLSLLRLERDPVKILRARREAGCENLYDCEEQWILARGTSQARCPSGCSHFKPIEVLS